MRRTSRTFNRAFTLLELLVVIGIIALILAVLLPALSGARVRSQEVVCGSNLRQLGHAFLMYANDYEGKTMPLAYTAPEIIDGGSLIYWWGTNGVSGVDHTRGFVWPYLKSDLRTAGVYECPSQPWGSYKPQGATQMSVTSTYGYNGYYLCPPQTPGWSFQIGNRPWRTVEKLGDTSRVFVFGDTMLAWAAGLQNNALLDPPRLFQNPIWTVNTSPTTSFRHRDRTQMVHGDGHVESHRPGDNNPSQSTNPLLREIWQKHRVASVGKTNDPHYVPDCRDW